MGGGRKKEGQGEEREGGRDREKRREGGSPSGQLNQLDVSSGAGASPGF